MKKSFVVLLASVVFPILSMHFDELPQEEHAFLKERIFFYRRLFDIYEVPERSLRTITSNNMVFKDIQEEMELRLPKNENDSLFIETALSCPLKAYIEKNNEKKHLRFDTFVLNPDRTQIALIDKDYRDEKHCSNLALYDLKEQKITEYHELDYEVERLKYSHDGTQLTLLGEIKNSNYPSSSIEVENDEITYEGEKRILKKHPLSSKTYMTQLTLGKNTRPTLETRALDNVVNAAITRDGKILLLQQERTPFTYSDSYMARQRQVHKFTSHREKLLITDPFSNDTARVHLENPALTHVELQAAGRYLVTRNKKRSSYSIGDHISKQTFELPPADTLIVSENGNTILSKDDDWSKPVIINDIKNGRVTLRSEKYLYPFQNYPPEVSARGNYLIRKENSGDTFLVDLNTLQEQPVEHLTSISSDECYLTRVEGYDKIIVGFIPGAYTRLIDKKIKMGLSKEIIVAAGIAVACYSRSSKDSKTGLSDKDKILTIVQKMLPDDLKLPAKKF